MATASITCRRHATVDPYDAAVAVDLATTTVARQVDKLRSNREALLASAWVAAEPNPGPALLELAADHSPRLTAALLTATPALAAAVNPHSTDVCQAVRMFGDEAARLAAEADQLDATLTARAGL